MTAHALLHATASALLLDPDRADDVTIDGHESLPSCFPVTDLAVSAIGAAGLAVADLLDAHPRVTVDCRLASHWFRYSLAPSGWQPPPAWDPIAGDYQASDGWIRLHTNAPRHRAAALAVLGCVGERAAVTAAVAGWTAGALETAIVDAGGCAAAMRAADAWRTHPQGRAVMAEPLIAFDTRAATTTRDWQPCPERPLAGIRILDLTRILAGPVATRLLAGLGADVLRIDPPGWEEPSLVADITLGKRCARLDLEDGADRRRFETLLSEADVLVHGYRPGALAGLGYGEAARRAIAPDLIEVTLCAYGWTGPWAVRRGFDSLVQMSSGIAEAGMRWQNATQPFPLPVQALDHATGYLMAASAIRGLAARRRDGTILSARASLARTAALLVDAGMERTDATPLGAVQPGDLAEAVEHTPWGPGRRLRPPLAIAGVEIGWSRPACDLGSSPAAWADGVV